MTSFINVPPPNRGPSIGEQIGRGFGEGFGGSMQQAASGFLQGKIQQMFANQERDRMRPSALALAKTLNIPVDQQRDLAEMFIDNPTLAAQAFIHRPSRMSVNDRLGIPSPTVNMQQPPTPQQMNPYANQAPPSSLNPARLTSMIPEEGYLPMVQQQFQRARQEEPYQAQQQAQAARQEEAAARSPFPEVPTEQEKQVSPEKETGITIPEILPKPDLDHYRQLIAQANTDDEQKQLAAQYNALNDRYLKSVQAHNDAIAKSDKMKRDAEKGAALTKADDKYLDEIDAEIKQAKKASSALDTMEEMVNTGDIGWIYNPLSAEARENRGLFEEAQTPIASMIREDIFKGQLTDTKFKKLINDWTPSPNVTDATNRGRIEGLRRIIQFGLNKEKALESVRNPDGTYPKNIRGRIDKFLSEEEKKIKKMINKGPGEVFVNGAQVDKPPPASAFKEGEGFTDNVTKIKYVKKNGQMLPVK